MTWFIPMGFWVVGMAFMVGGAYVGHKLSEKKEQLLQDKRESEQMKDMDATIYFGIEQEILDMMPWVSVRLFTVVIGMVIFALGFVAMSFVL